MAAVEANISISLDGFVTGPMTRQHQGLGQGGEILHAWLQDPDGERLITETFAAAGAVITSRKVYEMTGGWGEDGFYRMPVFVLTHRPHDPVVKRSQRKAAADWQARVAQSLGEAGHGDTTFTFVTEGIGSAVAQARAAAGDRIVHIMGGATVIQQALNAGLVDELQLHIAPVVLGAGTRLFDNLVDPVPLERIAVSHSRMATHLRFRVVK